MQVRTARKASAGWRPCGQGQPSSKSFSIARHWLAAKRSIVVITAHTSEAGGGGSDFVPTAVEIKDETADGDDEFLTICEAVRGNLSNASTNSLLPNTDIVIKPKHSEHFTGCLRGLSDSQINWLIAKNGHGKSTVAAALGGLIKPGWGFWPLRYPDGFHLEMGDWPGRSIPNREVHVVLQDPYRSFIESRVSSDLPQTFVNIHESIWGGLKRMPTDFSFGQLRFLQLLLIPRNARLVILDEPLLGLSPRNRAHMLNFIRWLATSSRGVICTALDASEKCLGEIAIHI